MHVGPDFEEADEIAETPRVARPDLSLGDVVTTASDPRPNALNVQCRGGETDIPDAHLETGRRGPVKFTRDALPAECGFEREAIASVDRATKGVITLLPALCVGLREFESGRHELTCAHVRVVVGTAGAGKEFPGNRALAGAICAGGDEDPPALSHAGRRPD